jgi:catechol 2,3-dioxygenase-like lactoylglutathione lyase family enzyme
MFGKINSLLLYVSDLTKSREFYTALKFKITDSDTTSFKAACDNFTLWCFDQNQVKYPQDSQVMPKGAGVFIYYRVPDVDAFYAYLLSQKLNPSHPPQNQSWGNREFCC